MRIYAGLFLFSLAMPCLCQVMLEHAAAAAGGSVGAVAGKPVGQSIGKIFGNLDKTTAKAAKAKPDASKPKEPSDGEASRTKNATLGSSSAYPVFGSATSGADMSASGGGVTRRNHPTYRPTAATLTAEPGSEAMTPKLIPTPVHHTSHEDVIAIQPGMARSEVIAKLGLPASMVTIPDEGHLLESFKYILGNRWLGTVRLDNGSVVRVDSAQ